MHFLSVLIKCGLIRRKFVCDELKIIIRNDQWTSVKSEYELVNIEIIKSKVGVLVENKLKISCATGVYHLLELDIKIILYSSKHLNNTILVIFLQ